MEQGLLFPPRAYLPVPPRVASGGDGYPRTSLTSQIAQQLLEVIGSVRVEPAVPDAGPEGE